MDDVVRFPATTAGGSCFADRSAAEEAVAMALPMIEAAVAKHQVGDSGFLHLVIMDPALSAGQVEFEQAILYEHSIGDRDCWDADYAAYARAKARLSWRTGQSTCTLQATSPQLLRRGDTSLWGSAVVDGIVVGVSGAHPWYDEAFATVVAAFLRAVAKGRAQRAGGVLAVE